MLRRSFTLTNHSGELIRGDLRHREDIKNAPLVIFCHGFKGFKDWGFFPIAATRLADDGYVSLTFNFSRNGIGADLQNFTEFDLFARNTYNHELKDLKCVVDAVFSGALGRGIIDTEKIALVGHSRGGGIALLYAAKDKRIGNVITWAAISSVERFSAEEITLWEKEGHITIENSRTKQLLRLGKDILNDIRKDKKSLDILSAAAKLNVPVLLIHGDSDESVPVTEANAIFNVLDTELKNIEIIENASHTFGIRHPSETSSPEFDLVLDLTESWLDNYLNL